MSVRLREHVSATDTTDALILLDGRAGRYWQLNTTAAIIVRALLDGTDPARIAQDLAAANPVSVQQASADLRALLAQLAKANLIETATP
ncbi:lasso peptide biosynthesis PqqD family chaperone [Nonomuraea purpurea]|uniref:Lasso peptide biosynthesis PqqD family chaperone n=1 Tax=Nonomuraea purpurea TaxID=1849276 RepID=A0ABV8GTG1_9ACTN